MSPTGTCWRAWPSPALLKEPLAWKLPVSTDSFSLEQWEQQGPLHLSKLPASLPCTPVSMPSCTLEQGMLHPGHGVAPSASPLTQGHTGPRALWVLQRFPWESTHEPACSLLLAPCSWSPFTECLAVFCISVL